MRIVRWFAANGILCPVAALPTLQGFSGVRWGPHLIPGEYSEHPSYLHTPPSPQPLRSVDSRLLRHLLYDERERVHEEQLVDDAEQLPTSGTSRHGQVGLMGTAKWEWQTMQNGCRPTNRSIRQQKKTQKRTKRPGQSALAARSDAECMRRRRRLRRRGGRNGGAHLHRRAGG